MPEKDKNKSQQNGTEQQEQSYSLKVPNFGDKLAAGIGGATSILDSTIDLAQTNDGYEDEIARIRNQAFSPSGTYSLMEQYNNMYWGAPKTLYDFTGKTSGDYAKGILGTTATGALAGTQIMPGIGTAFGALLGLGAGIIGMGANQIKGNREYKADQKERADAIDLALGNFDATNNAYKQNQFSNAMKSFYRSAEYGGLLGTHGSDFSNDIKYINVGDTHEQNPNNGVLMGVDEEGTPNLVEEGEVIFNDYVFSARLKPSKKALNDSLIGDKYLGMTYAEIAEKLAEKSEEMPTDKIEQNTLNANFKRLITIQEEQRARNEQREANKFKGGGPLSKEEYDKEVERINREYTDGAERRKKLQEATERYMRSDDYKFISRMSRNRNRNIGRNNSGTTSVDQTTLDALRMRGFPVVSDQNIEAQNKIDELIREHAIEEKAAQTAEETVAKSDPSGATSSSNAASTSSGASANSGARSNNSTRKTVSTSLPPINSWQDLTSAIGAYDVSKNRGNISGTYRIDNRFPLGEFKTISDLENSDKYKEFTEYIINHSGDKDVLDYLRALDAGTAEGVEKLFDGDNLRSGWDQIYRKRRNDQKGGIYHFSGDINSVLSNSSNTRTPSEAILPKDRLPNEPTLESVLGVKPDGLHDPDRPRIDTYTGPGVEGEEEPKDYSYLLRYAPVLGNALALLSNRKDYSDVHRFEGMTANPRTVRFSPIGTYIRPNLVAPSEMSTPIENQMANERNYISNNSLGNSTASNNYMLASDYLGNSRIGAAYLQGKQYNAEQRQKAAAYNLGIDQYNSEGAFKEQQQNMSLNNYYLQRAIYDYNMRNGIDTAYNQARSSNLTALFNNLGNIGLDTFNARRANAASPLYNQLSNGEIEYLRKMMEERKNGE